MTNPMRAIRIEKLTLNIGVGKDPAKLDRAIALIEKITKRSPIKTYARKRIPAWGLRPGLPIGCKLTIRGKEAKELLSKLLEAIDRKLSTKNFDSEGNISFGIKEYIDIPNIKYDPKIGIIGLQACVSLERAGFRIKRRKLRKRKVPKRHRITKPSAIEFMKREFGVEIEK